MSAAYTLTNRSLGDHRAELTSVQSRARPPSGRRPSARQLHRLLGAAPEAHRDVRALAASRFDWSHALHEVARTIPSDAWLTSMSGTVSPSVNAEGGGSDPLRASLPAPRSS